MITIKSGACTITIYDVSQLKITQLRKLLKLASNRFDNDPSEVRADFIDAYDVAIAHENHHLEEMKTLGATKRDIKSVEGRRDQYIKARGIVEQWVI